jgi:hypothetical protein
VISRVPCWKKEKRKENSSRTAPARAIKSSDFTGTKKQCFFVIKIFLYKKFAKAKALVERFHEYRAGKEKKKNQKKERVRAKQPSSR